MNQIYPIIYITSISNMHKVSKQSPPLQLQSYKIDTSQLQSKIHELDQLKSQLQSSLQKQKKQEDNFFDELHTLKIENQKLKSEIAKLEQTNQTQKILIKQLQKKLAAKEQQATYFQEVMEKEKEKRRMAEQEYQYQLKYMFQERERKNNLSPERTMKTSKVVEVNDGREFNEIINRFSERTITDSEQSSSNDSKKIKRLKKPSKQSILPSGIKTVEPMNKYKMINSIPERQQESNLTAEDIYLEMIRFLYKQLIKIEIKAKQLYKIPIIDSFSHLRSPTKNDVCKLFANHPFQIKQTHKAEIVYNFLIRELERKGKQLSGAEIVKQITNALEEIQTDRDASIYSGGSSCFMSDSQLTAGHLGSCGFRRMSKPSMQVAECYEIQDGREAIQQCDESSQMI